MFTDEMCDEGFQPAPNVAKEMDFTICSCCAALLRYDSDKSVRIATEDDMEDLEPIQQAMFELSRMIVLHPEYQRKFKAGELRNDRR